jgi:hypothetical protein
LPTNENYRTYKFLPIRWIFLKQANMSALTCPTYLCN